MQFSTDFSTHLFGLVGQIPQLILSYITSTEKLVQFHTMDYSYSMARWAYKDVFQQAKRIRSTVTRLKTKSKRMSHILRSKSEQVEHEDKLPNTGNK